MNVLPFRSLAAALLLAVTAHGAAPRDTPFDQLRDEYDVVIAGAGTGGFGVAMQAARMGRSVLVLEATDWIGGQAMAAGVTSMDEAGPLVRERGLYHEFVERVVEHYRQLGMSAETAYSRRSICMEPRVGQEIFYTMLDEARAKSPALHVALGCRVVDVEKGGDTVTGARVQCDTKTRTFHSKILVDATEWGDVIPMTGARFRIGKFLSDGPIDPTMQIQDLTWTATIKQYPQGVPEELRMKAAPPDFAQSLARFQHTLVAEAPAQNSARPWGFKTFVGYRGMPNSEQPQNKALTRTHMNFNNDSPVYVSSFEEPHRTRTEYAGIVRTLNLLWYVQHDLGKSDWSVANDEGYDTPRQRKLMSALLRTRPDLEPYREILNHFAVMAYARESRRIVGLHTLTAKEIERNPGRPQPFATSVALGDYPVDLHGSKKADVLELDLDKPEDAPVGKFGEKGRGPFAIPFECFIPEKVDGFLPAEKNLSQSRLANGATRLQPSTMLMGQAVGAIAALSIKYDVPPRRLDPALVQSALLDAGDTLYLEPVADVPKSGWEWKPVQFAVTRGWLDSSGGPLSRRAAAHVGQLRSHQRQGRDAVRPRQRRVAASLARRFCARDA